MQRSLLIGCGKNLTKQVQYDGKAEWAGKLITMDVNRLVNPTFVFDMEEVARGGQMPFFSDVFDEIGCYNAMEHWGRQGDFRGWFHECGEYWRILKPGGLMSILVPIGPDALADPGHTRFFHQNWFAFLSQSFYDRNEVLSTCFTDYRGWAWDKNFDILYIAEHGEPKHHLAVVLRKA